MNNSQCTQWCDKEQMADLLSLEKFLAGNYNAFLLECATPEMMRCLSSLLSDTHDMQQQIFHTMQTRGWYPTPKAEDTKLMQTKQQFATAVTR